MKYDIHKVGAVMLRNGKLLVCRSKTKDIFLAPGGKIEKGETASAALIRELKEEVAVSVTSDNLDFLDTYYAPAAGKIGQTLRMDVYVVKMWIGDPAPSSEVEEIRWIGEKIPDGISVGSVITHDIIPKLIKRGLLEKNEIEKED